MTSCIICQSNPNHLLVSTRNGVILKWDWTTGRKLRQWKTPTELFQIIGIPDAEPSQVEDRILLLHDASEEYLELSHCNLNQSSDRLLEIILLRRIPATGVGLTVLDGGKTLVARAGDKLMLCSSPNSLASAKPVVNDFSWREVTVPGKIASFDARSRLESAGSKNRVAVDVVLGLQDGAILVYDDILFKLIGKERGLKGVGITSRRLHWHRDTVLSVKWSRDGKRPAISCAFSVV